MVNRANLDFLKQLVDLGVSLEIPYKSKLQEWYSPRGISLTYFCKKYRVCFGGDLITSKDDFEKVYLYFVRCCNNIGAVQKRVQEEYQNELDPEIDWDKIKELVMEEMKKIPKEARCPKLELKNLIDP